MTIREFIQTHGEEKNYIFFQVGTTGTDRTIRIIAFVAEKKVYAYAGEMNPVSWDEVQKNGVSETECRFFRDNALSGIKLCKALMRDLDREVNFSCSQEETNDGRSFWPELGIYAMFGEVKKEYYDVFYDRTGYARITAYSSGDADKEAEELLFDDISWSDSYTVNSVFVSDDQSDC